MARVTIGQALLEYRPDLRQRMATHEREKDWWQRVNRAATRIEYYDCRSTARAAETTAIKAEQPLHNDQHNGWVEAGLMRDTDVAELITDEVVAVLECPRFPVLRRVV